jgi:glutathione peroxidase
MRRMILTVAVTLALAGLLRNSVADEAATTAPAQHALGFNVKDIDGKNVDLSQYAGKVVLIVNVASKCGNTPQYEALEKAYNQYKDKGFVILGFPANNFHAQEPGSDLEIKQFCTATYGVTFPMFSKISVKGDDMAPLYKYLTSVDTQPKAKGDITWNFEKFLIGRDGNVAARFDPKTKPDSPEVVSAVEAALAK